MVYKWMLKKEFGRTEGRGTERVLEMFFGKRAKEGEVGRM